MLHIYFCPWLASFDGNSISFSTLAGVQRGAIAAGPTDCLWEVLYQLMAHHRAGMLGAGIGRVDVVLPCGCSAPLPVRRAVAGRTRLARYYISNVYERSVSHLSATLR